MIGANTVAISMVAGAQIKSVAFDPGDASQSAIGFTIGDDGNEHSLPLTEFRRRIGGSLLNASSVPTALSENPNEAELQQAIGIRNVLLAPVFGARLEELIVHGDGTMFVALRTEDGIEEVDLTAFQEYIAERIRNETNTDEGQGGPAIDLSIIPKARSASAAGDHATVTSMIGPWLNSLAVLIRSGQMKTLAAEVRDELTEAIALLGASYSELLEHGMADEVFRLGVQWADETSFASDMYFLLGETSIAQQAWGEAIGPLRRAVHLGGDEKRALGGLVRCFVERNQFVAARVCLERANAHDLDTHELEELIGRFPKEAIAAWDAFAKFIQEKTT